MPENVHNHMKYDYDNIYQEKNCCVSSPKKLNIKYKFIQLKNAWLTQVNKRLKIKNTRL